MRRLKTNGFTIIELLIATVVFSVVLLILTTAIIQFSRIYYKGNVASKTQETARSVMNSVSQDIQFGASVGTTSAADDQIRSIAIAGNCYTYKLNTKVTSGQHGMVQSKGTCPSGSFPSDGTELLGENMQLAGLSITRVGATNLYKVSVHVVYGDNDDFASSDKKSCKAIILGGQFCSVAELSTTVEKRLK